MRTPEEVKFIAGIRVAAMAKSGARAEPVVRSAAAGAVRAATVERRRAPERARGRAEACMILVKSSERAAKF